MFAKLLIKEWREKALLLVFGILVLAAFVPAFFGLAGKPQVLEWLTYGLVLIFFPFVGLLVGSAGFEAEHRNDAWAFLLSRPVAKLVAWAAKYLASLSVLGALWLGFATMWFVLPGFRDLAATTRGVLGFDLELGFPWLSVLASAFLLTVAFATSMISERPFNTIFASLIMGGASLGLVHAALRGLFRGILAWSEHGRWLSTFEFAMGLMTLAVGAASALTFARADFSQPVRKTLRLSALTAALLVPVLLATGAWAFLGPTDQPAYLYPTISVAGEPLYESNGGIFKYAVKKDKIQWLTKSLQYAFFQGFGRGTEFLFCEYKPTAGGGLRQEFWVIDVETLKKRRVEGMSQEWQKLSRGLDFTQGMMSPDGHTLVLAAVRDDRRPGAASPLWIIRDDGKGYENLPADPRIVQGQLEHAYLRFLAFSPDGKGFAFEQIKWGKEAYLRLWWYDLEGKASRLILEDVSWMPTSAGSDFVALRHRVQPDNKLVLSLLDLRTQAISDLYAMGSGGFLPIAAWDSKGDRIAFIKTASSGGAQEPYTLIIYSLPERKVVVDKAFPGLTEREGRLASPQWLADDSGIVLNSPSGLRVLGPDLRERLTVAYPAALKSAVSLRTAGHSILVQDEKTDALWRYDLNMGTWKRIY